MQRQISKIDFKKKEQLHLLFLRHEMWEIFCFGPSSLDLLYYLNAYKVQASARW